MNAVPEPEKEPHWTRSLLTAGKRTWRYEKRFGLRMIGWALTMAGSMYLLKNDLVTTSPYNWIIACVPLVMAGFPLHAYYQFFTSADEMVRKIQIESVVIGFLVGLLYTIARQPLEAAGLEPASAGDPP